MVLRIKWLTPPWLLCLELLMVSGASRQVQSVRAGSDLELDSHVGSKWRSPKALSGYLVDPPSL